MQSEDSRGSRAGRELPAPGRPVFPGRFQATHQSEVWLDLAVKESDCVKATYGSVRLESRSSRSHGVPR